MLTDMAQAASTTRMSALCAAVGDDAAQSHPHSTFQSAARAHLLERGHEGSLRVGLIISIEQELVDALAPKGAPIAMGLPHSHVVCAHSRLDLDHVTSKKITTKPASMTRMQSRHSAKVLLLLTLIGFLALGTLQQQLSAMWLRGSPKSAPTTRKRSQGCLHSLAPCKPWHPCLKLSPIFELTKKSAATTSASSRL